MKKSRIISLFLALLLMMTTTQGFGQTILHENEARNLYELNLFQGISASEFVPDLQSMSNREQAMTIIARALQWQMDMNAKSPFGDVSEWAQPYVAKAYQMGITKGISATEFGAKRNVTQRELATWMLRALGFQGNEAWESTAQLSGYIGTRLDAAKMNAQINRDVLVGMLYSFMKEGKVVSSEKTLIQEYVQKHPEYVPIATASGMIVSQSEQKEIPSIGLVLDTLGIEKSYINRMVWEGIQKYANENNMSSSEYGYVKATSDSDLSSPFSKIITDDRDVIIANGYMFNDTISQYAYLNPNKRFIIIDSYVDRPNVTSILFNEEQGAFLVGVAAGLKALEDGMKEVGFIGGIDFELIQKFEAGYEAGVKAVDPSIEVVVAYIDTFVESSSAKSAAATMFSDGAYVIFHAAGPAGMGVIEEAKSRSSSGEPSWVIGVDYDQYDDGIYQTGKSVILTSMIKKFDIAVFNACEHISKEGLNGATLFYGLENDSIGLPSVNPNLNQDMIRKINDYKEQIISGERIVPVVP